MVAGFRIICLTEAAEEVIRSFAKRDNRAMVSIESERPLVLKMVFKNWLVRRAFEVGSVITFMQRGYPALKYRVDYDVEEVE